MFVNSWEKPTPQAIFGGHKESGIGGEWGKEGLKVSSLFLSLSVLRVDVGVLDADDVDL